MADSGGSKPPDKGQSQRRTSASSPVISQPGASGSGQRRYTPGQSSSYKGNGSILDEMNQQGMVVYIKLPTGDVTTIHVKPNDRIRMINVKIYEQTGISVRKQILRFDGKELENSRKLSDYGITDHSTIHLSIRTEKGMAITIRGLTGNVTTIHAEPEDTIGMLKLKIKSQINISPDDQGLVVGGKELEDDKTLLDYNISNESTIHFVVRTKKGSEVPPRQDDHTASRQQKYYRDNTQKKLEEGMMKFSELEVEQKETEAQLSAVTEGRPQTARPFSRMVKPGQKGAKGAVVGAAVKGKDDDIVFETFYHRSGKEYQCKYQSGMRFYLDDWGSKEWQPFPKRWYNEGLLVTNTLLKNENAEQGRNEQAAGASGQGQWSRSQGRSQGQGEGGGGGGGGVDDREGFLMHPTKGRVPTYIFYKKHNVHMYFDRDNGSWVRMPVGWELHHNMVKSLVDQIDKAVPRWGDLHDILSLLRACNYDPDECISIYLHLEKDEWMKGPKSSKENKILMEKEARILELEKRVRHLEIQLQKEIAGREEAERNLEEGMMKFSELEVEQKETEAQLSAVTEGRPQTARPFSRMVKPGQKGAKGAVVGAAVKRVGEDTKESMESDQHGSGISHSDKGKKDAVTEQSPEPEPEPEKEVNQSGPKPKPRPSKLHSPEKERNKQLPGPDPVKNSANQTENKRPESPESESSSCGPASEDDVSEGGNQYTSIQLQVQSMINQPEDGIKGPQGSEKMPDGKVELHRNKPRQKSVQPSETTPDTEMENDNNQFELEKINGMYFLVYGSNKKFLGSFDNANKVTVAKNMLFADKNVYKIFTDEAGNPYLKPVEMVTVPQQERVKPLDAESDENLRKNQTRRRQLPNHSFDTADGATTKKGPVQISTCPITSEKDGTQKASPDSKSQSQDKNHREMPPAGKSYLSKRESLSEYVEVSNIPKDQTFATLSKTFLKAGLPVGIKQLLFLEHSENALIICNSSEDAEKLSGCEMLRPIAFRCIERKALGPIQFVIQKTDVIRMQKAGTLDTFRKKLEELKVDVNETDEFRVHAETSQQISWTIKLKEMCCDKIVYTTTSADEGFEIFVPKSIIDDIQSEIIDDNVPAEIWKILQIEKEEKIKELEKTCGTLSYDGKTIIATQRTESCSRTFSDFIEVFTSFVKKIKKMEIEELDIDAQYKDDIHAWMEEIDSTMRQKCCIFIPNECKIIVYVETYEEIKQVKHHFLFKQKKIKPTGRRRKTAQENHSESGPSSLQARYTLNAEDNASCSRYKNNADFEWDRDAKNVTTYKTDENIQVYVYEAYILNLPVDCIVNAANDTLSHGGGVANVIADGAGMRLNQEGKSHIQSHGKIPVGYAMSTTAGNLPYKYVIHTVGPRWGDYRPHGFKDISRCESDLTNAVYNSFLEAEKHNLTKIALPAISAAIFGVPEDLCVSMYVRATLKYSQDRTAAPVNEIHFIDKNPKIIALLQNEFDTVLTKGEVSPYLRKSHRKGQCNEGPVSDHAGLLSEQISLVLSPEHKVTSDKKDIFLFCGKEDKRLLIYSGNILSVKDSAIVVTIDERKNEGSIARSVTRNIPINLKSAYRQELDRNLSHNCSTGTLAITKGYSTDFSRILHVVFPTNTLRKNPTERRKDLKTVYHNIFMRTVCDEDVQAISTTLIGIDDTKLDDVDMCADVFLEEYVFILKEKLLERIESFDVHLVCRRENVTKRICSKFKEFVEKQQKLFQNLAKY